MKALTLCFAIFICVSSALAQLNTSLEDKRLYNEALCQNPDGFKAAHQSGGDTLQFYPIYNGVYIEGGRCPLKDYFVEKYLTYCWVIISTEYHGQEMEIFVKILYKNETFFVETSFYEYEP